MKQPFKIILLVFSIVICTSQLFAQAKESFWDKTYFGGNFGLQFGDQTVIDINPMMGYKLTEKLSVGVTATYIYYRFTNPYFTNVKYSSNIYGGSIFSRYYFFENVFGHVEGEVLNLEVPDNFLQRYVRKNIFGFYVGGGYRQPMGERSSLNILLLYNLNEDRNSPYQNPIIRIGFGFGI